MNWRATGMAMAMAMAGLLGGCAQAPVRPAVVDAARSEQAQAAREQALATQRAWGFTGRLAVSTDGHGGSGRIEWTQDGDDFDVRLLAPVTRQGWRLHRAGGVVRLEGLEDGPREGTDAEALLFDATGWRLPVTDMVAWVRGARGAGSPATVESDAAGLPRRIGQSGWQVDYPAWTGDVPPLPTRVNATQGEARVRLAIESWSVVP
jgi:outer membrane lipoprotein LolB